MPSVNKFQTPVGTDLPVDRATKFALVLNMKAAHALGLNAPLSLQMRIDEVIE